MLKADHVLAGVFPRSLLPIEQRLSQPQPSLVCKPKTMIVASFGSISNPKKLPIDQTWKWAFLGTDRQKRLRLTRIFGEAQRLPYANELHQVMEECRQEFMDRLGEIGSRQSSPLHWWATRIASKSPYLSDLFLYFCYFKLLMRWSSVSTDNKVLAIVDNRCVLQAAALELGTKATFMVDPRDSFHERISRVIWQSAGLVFAAKLTCWWALNLYHRLRHRRRWRTLNDTIYDVMVYSWVEDRSFANGNQSFVDPYLGKLVDFYRDKGLSVARVAPVTLPRNLLPRLYQTEEDIIPLSAFIALRDILEVAASRPTESVSFGKDNHWFTILCNGERTRESYVSRWYLLYHRAYQHFWGSYGSKLRHTFIYPFENQPWEKMLLLSLKGTKPSFSVIGYQHSTMPWFLLNYHLGRGEDKFMPFPDLVISNGAFHEHLMKSMGYPCEIRDGGSLRYSLKGNSAIPSMNSLTVEKEKNVLVLLGPTKLHALELVDYILRIAPRIDKNFTLKAHPDLPASLLKRWVGPLPVNVTFVEGPLERYLGQAAYVIHMGTTAAFECFQHGMQIFKYLPEIIDLDPLYKNNIPQETLTWNLIPSFKPGTHKMFSVDTDFFREPMLENTWMDLISSHEDEGMAFIQRPG